MAEVLLWTTSHSKLCLFVCISIYLSIQYVHVVTLKSIVDEPVEYTILITRTFDLGWDLGVTQFNHSVTIENMHLAMCRNTDIFKQNYILHIYCRAY